MNNQPAPAIPADEATTIVRLLRSEGLAVSAEELPTLHPATLARLRSRVRANATHPRTSAFLAWIAGRLTRVEAMLLAASLS